MPLQPDVDILFVIDDSSSMASAQASLAASFSRFVSALRSLTGELPSVHIGVVSTDVGAGPFEIDGCSVSGDNGALQSAPRVPGCQGPADSFILDLEQNDGTRRRNYSGSLEDAFACIAQLGTSGCDFEQPLEAMRRALNDSNPTSPEPPGCTMVAGRERTRRTFTRWPNTHRSCAASRPIPRW